jgi:hypothetical protein
MTDEACYFSQRDADRMLAKLQAFVDQLPVGEAVIMASIPERAPEPRQVEGYVTSATGAWFSSSAARSQ